jgi:filamin
LSANESLNSNINAVIASPTGKSIPITRSVTQSGNIKLTFIANEVGIHQLEVTYLNLPIAGSPFEIKIYDSSRIIVSDVKGLEINRICEFTIDATNGGEGQLEISINDGLIKNNVKQIKPGTYAVNFLPIKQDFYTVDVKFNGEVVPGCPKRIHIKDAQMPKIIGSPPENVLFGSVTSFNLGSVVNLSCLDVKIVSPSGEHIIPKIKQINNEECKIEWTPLQLGTYLINILYSDTPIKGTPLKVKIYDPKKVQIYNIQDGCAFKPNSFCVDASLAGEGSLEIGISCNGNFIPNQVKPLGNSKFEVHFLPQEPVIHYANINFNGESVKGMIQN